MKKLLLIIFLIIFIVGCRKGEDDPLISLAGRTHRIVGTWKLSNLEYTFEYNQDGNVIITAGNFADGILTYTTHGSLTEKDYSLELKINKDGTFLADEYVDNMRRGVSGFWTFGDSGKNKLFVIFSSVFAKEFSTGSTFYIKRLSEKELTLYYYYSASFEEEDVFGTKSVDLILFFQKEK